MRSLCPGSLSAVSRAKATIALSAMRCVPSAREDLVAGEVLEEQERPDALVAVGEGVVLDDEVERIRGAQLYRWIERLPVERLLDGAEDRGELLAALLAEEAAGLPARPARAILRSAMRSWATVRVSRNASASGRGGASASRPSSYSSSSRQARV